MDPNYFDLESARGEYYYPLPTEKPRLITAAGVKLAEGTPAEQLYRTGPFVCDKSPASHTGAFRHAIDFLVLDGTDVLAARDGEVTTVVDGWTGWGNDPSFASRMNYLTISHEGGEQSQYCHLAKGTVVVREGQAVKAGQMLAKVGKVGWTDRDHLHFLVFRPDANPDGFKSLRVEQFLTHRRRRFWFF